MNNQIGTAIAIAWPETFCKQPGSWYDNLNALLGFNKNGYYKVGHAALVLISHKKQEAHYYDFGRYHAPFQHGRVRSAVTDHELKINTIAKIKNEKVTNLLEILNELNHNESCHGDGVLIAGQTSINFKSAQQKVLELQESCPLPYGPFDLKGTNCSRFVNSALLAGKPSLLKRFILKLTISSTPMWNIKAIGERIKLEKIEQNNISSEVVLTPAQQ